MRRRGRNIKNKQNEKLEEDMKRSREKKKKYEKKRSQRKKGRKQKEKTVPTDNRGGTCCWFDSRQTSAEHPSS